MTVDNQGKIGLIDIGSNSVRLVIYDRLQRVPTSIYNEKVMCRLGQGLGVSGRLNPAGVVMACQAIARFVALAKNMEVTELDFLATAAVRDASDGLEFVDNLERTHNIHIEVISGQREAKLAAYGVLSSIHKPVGLVADLGGGSLELAFIDEQQHICERVSLPLGVLRLVDEYGTPEAIQAVLADRLQHCTWLQKAAGLAIYGVGGSFRNIARVHMRAEDYCLALTHGYSLEADHVAPLLSVIATADEATLSDMPGISSKRVNVLPAAAMVLDALFRVTSAQSVVFSNSGIREGYLYEKLAPYVRAEDMLTASCMQIAGSKQHSLNYAIELLEWMEPLLVGQSHDTIRIVYAACVLQNIARYIHPDQRAAWAFYHTIQSNLYGLSHPQRVLLALTLFHRSQYRLKSGFPELELLRTSRHDWAQLIGTAISLAHHLSGGVAGTLARTSIEINKDGCSLQVPEDMQALRGEIIDKRLGALHQSFMEWAA